MGNSIVMMTFLEKKRLPRIFRSYWKQFWTEIWSCILYATWVT
jgi:hypothetical protein